MMMLFEPKTPCREMETRSCVELTTDEAHRFRVDECPAGSCRRYEISMTNSQFKIIIQIEAEMKSVSED